MNSRMYSRAVEIAAALKGRRSGKSHHVSTIYKKGKPVAIGVNDYGKPHNENRFGKYEDHKGYTTQYRACRHAEISAIIRYGEEDLSDCEMLVVRINANNSPVLSRPCVNCARVLAGLKIKKVFYSDENGDFKKDERF